jgi:Uma2 family endonuclease
MRQITVDKYHAMIDAGILTEDDPVELLEGHLVVKTPKTPPHRVATGSARKALEEILPPGWFVDSHEPITTLESEPEPDVTVVRGDSDDFAQRHPGPQDLGLLVEVADSTLARDRGTKKRIFARARVAVYWIVNLVDMQIEVHAVPTGPAEQPDYRQKQVYKRGESIPVVLDGKEIGTVEVNSLLP